MAIQVGTVDGLVNISEQPISCFVEAIDKFSIKGVSFAKANNISLGTAFQRFVEPVYKNTTSVFDVNSILIPALTSSGKEQSPARVTYCKKMGLLEIDESNDIFRLTLLGQLIKNNEISVGEYAFILLSKMGIFVNGVLVDNLFCSLARYFKEHATISDEEYQSYVVSCYKDDTILKTRFDIIVGALCVSGLITKVAKNLYVLSSTIDARIFEETLKYEMQLKSAFLDNDSNYAEFVGNLRTGVFSILHEQNIDVYTSRFENLRKFIGHSKEESIHKDLVLNERLDSLQQIFYGAPGTGKSFSVDEICKKYTHFRTTFHPDSDYFTFVGCYKPKTRRAEPIYSKLQLIDKLSVIKSSGASYPCHKFAAKYWESLKDLSTADIKDILTACGFTESMNVEITKGIAVGEELGKGFGNTTITYEFVPQAFTNAYIEAWKDLSKPVFLVIEEINRGNCAQIFGDLFQLLDRKEDGFSSYQIHPDADLKDYIAGRGLSIEGVKDNDGNDISDKLMSGELMTLPSNLHIWATMNTSDQSLFPIDSAFKRRWDWEYVPIEQPEEGAEGDPRKWKIKADGHWCYWWEFLQAINEEIEDVTHSEDKQLGYFFAKPQDGEYVDAKTFVSKVVFYLWNDVFKDENSEIFRYKELEGKWKVDMPAPKRDNLYFRSFVKGREDVDEKMVRWFVNNLLKEHKVILLNDSHQTPVTSDDNPKEEEIAWMRPYPYEDVPPTDENRTEDDMSSINVTDVNFLNDEYKPADQVENVDR